MDTLNLPPESTLIMDIPSEKDYQYESLFGSETVSSGSIRFLPVHFQNQGAKSQTKMACSRYGLCHAVNAQNEYIQGKDGMRYFELPAERYWGTYLISNPSAETDGATLQSALDQFKKLGYITGYSKISTIEDMKSSLDKIRPIYTGSQNGDWVSVRDNHIYKKRTDNKVVGHIFCIIGYDSTGWIAINSYGAKNGLFSIPYDLTDSLFTRYCLSDFRDEKVINDYKAEQIRLEALKNKNT